MKEMMQMFALVGAICLWAGAASVATGKSAAFPLERSGFAWWARLVWPSVAENSILTCRQRPTGDASIPIPSGSASGIATASAVSAVCSIIGTCALALISSLGSLIVTLTSMAATSQAQSSVAPGCSVSTRD